MSNVECIVAQSLRDKNRTDFTTGGAVVSPLRYRNYSLDGSFTFAFVAQSLRDKIVPIL